MPGLRDGLPEQDLRGLAMTVAMGLDWYAVTAIIGCLVVILEHVANRRESRKPPVWTEMVERLVRCEERLSALEREKRAEKSDKGDDKR